MSKLNQDGINLRFRLEVWLNFEKPCIQNEAGHWIVGRFKNGRLEGQVSVDDKLHFDAKGNPHGKYFLTTAHETKEVPLSAISKQLRLELLGIKALGRKPIPELLEELPLPFMWDMQETFAIISGVAQDRIDGHMAEFISECARKAIALDVNGRRPRKTL